MAITASLSAVSGVHAPKLTAPRSSARFLIPAGFHRPAVPAAVPHRRRRPALRPRAEAAPAGASTGPSPSPTVHRFDFLVLGSGIAGLTYALKAAEHGSVAVVTKGDVAEGATRYAQGGICAVLDAADSVEAHARDTMIAGAFLNDPRAVDVVCREGPARVLELADFGARFTRTAGGDLHLTREGGHSARRIVHAADATGAEIERALVAAVVAHPRIAVFEHHLAVDLVLGENAAGEPLALGADALDARGGAMTRFVAPVTMLATGGAGQVYPLTTNPAVATGDGLAMAHRARAAVANLEFVQFHPTALYAPQAPLPDGRAFLISEAVRGEGGRLLSADGRRRFMPAVDPRAELAPRDVVARAITAEMAATGAEHVLLDISHRPAAEVRSHFPTIAAHCSTALGLDITRDPIPVVPAQHYMCGGVLAGLDGETSVAGLYACGEVACSGLHGANRLASNSLLEGLVFGARAVPASAAHAERVDPAALAAVASGVEFSGPRAPRPLSQAASAWVAAKRGQLNRLMWDAAGIVRHHARLREALTEVAEIYVEIRALTENYGVNAETVELRNLVTCGELILSSAAQRRESRGGHYCEDFPEAVPAAARATVISTSIKRRLDLGKIKATKRQFQGSSPPGSPRRLTAPGRELSISPRSLEE